MDELRGQNKILATMCPANKNGNNQNIEIASESSEAPEMKNYDE